MFHPIEADVLPKMQPPKPRRHRRPGEQPLSLGRGKPFLVVGLRDGRSPVVLGEASTPAGAELLCRRLRAHLEGYTVIRVEAVGRSGFGEMPVVEKE